MAQVLASSRYATDLLLRALESVAMLADDRVLAPRSLEMLLFEANAALSRHDDPEAAVAALQVSINVVQTATGGPLPSRFAIIWMGRFGGHELGFGSDVDVMFVYEPLDADADLRPEGKQGPLVRSLDDYRAYYERWSSGWEARALLRAGFAGRARWSSGSSTVRPRKTDELLR